MNDMENAGDMIEPKPRNRPRFIPEIIVGAGYLLFFVLLIVACAAAFLITRAGSGVEPAPLATGLPPLTGIPHILATPALNTAGVFADDFDDNVNHWDKQISSWTKAEVLGGTLDLQTTDDNSFGFVLCVVCPYMDSPHYLQAEIGTDKTTDFDFGILTRASYSNEDFYLFGISPTSRQYFLFHHFFDQWWLRASGVNESIHSFPARNTLGIDVEDSVLQLYINGKMVDEYHEPGMSFETGQMGFYTGGSGFQVWVDNLVIEQKAGQ